MAIAPADRYKVKAECLRLLATLRLDASRSELIYTFVESYQRLSAEENKAYERELSKMEPEIRESAMEIMSSLRKEGIEIGVHKGKEELISILLEQRFSTLPEDLTERLDRLSSEQLDELGRVILGFGSLAELEAWLQARQAE